jgi:hypothetical protein
MPAEHKPSGVSGALLSLDFKLMNLFRKETENFISNVILHVLHNAHYNISPNRTLYKPLCSVSHKWGNTQLIMLDFYW